LASACKPDVLRPDICQYTRLNYRPTRAWFLRLFVKSCFLWGRRRDVHTVLGWFEPGLQAPLAKAFMGLSGLYATKLRYGGHERGVVSRGICKFPTNRMTKNQLQTDSRRVFPVFLVSFVTSIYPFLQNRVLPISMKMTDEPQIDAGFDIGSCSPDRRILAKAL
jgi:hypothetical protein